MYNSTFTFDKYIRQVRVTSCHGDGCVGWQTWTSTADVPVRLTAVLKGLDPSHTYEFRIVTKGPYGEISSAIEEIAADANYGKSNTTVSVELWSM